VKQEKVNVNGKIEVWRYRGMAKIREACPLFVKTK
jgi:hypothetical protein